MIPNTYPAYLDEDQFVGFWKEYLNNHQWKPDEDLSLYIHYPWCQSVCKFCVFGNLALKDGRPIVDKYEDASLRLLEKIGNTIKDSPKALTELSFGGGTASLWNIEKMKKMPEIIPGYYQIPLRRMEAHPSTLTKDMIDVYADVMKFHHISLGIQSFDRGANRSQGRIYTPLNKLKNIIEYIQSKGIFVNIDIICMFNGDTDDDWEIFLEDMRIAIFELSADSITVYPNYKSANFVRISKKLRIFLNGFLSTATHLCPSWNGLLSTEDNDIIRFADTPYFIRTTECHQFFKHLKIYNALCGHNPNVIGIGGFDAMGAFSCTANGDSLRGAYHQWDDEFLYIIHKDEIFSYLQDDNFEQLTRRGFSVGHQNVNIRN